MGAVMGTDNCKYCGAADNLKCYGVPATSQACNQLICVLTLIWYACRCQGNNSSSMSWHSVYTRDACPAVLRQIAQLTQAKAAGLVCHPQAMLLMEVHSHLSSCEIIGLLGGMWDVNSRSLKIMAAYPCRSAWLSNLHVWCLVWQAAT